MPVLEAQLLGTPVVTTAWGAMADYTRCGVLLLYTPLPLPLLQHVEEADGLQASSSSRYMPLGTAWRSRRCNGTGSPRRAPFTLPTTPSSPLYLH